MKTWSDASEQGANLIFNSGQEMEIFKPNTAGLSRFRPIARPYPEFIRDLVPEFLPKAQELAKSLAPASDQFRQQLTMAARELCKAKGFDGFRVVDAQQDLVNATRQAMATNGQVPVMEWWRHGGGSIDIGAWALSLEVAAYWGVKSISVLDHTKPDLNATPEETDCEGRQTKGVFRKIFDELSTKAKTDPRWNQYIKVYKQNNHGAGRPQRMALTQVYLYEQNGRVAQQPVRCLFMINPMTLKSLEAQWNMPAGGISGGVPADFLSGFACGNLLDPERGGMITAYDQTSVASQQSGGAFGDSFGANKGGGGGQKTNYVAFIQPGQPLSDEVSSQSFKQWDDLLWIPTRKEAWMKALDSMGEHAVAYAGRHEIPLLPATVRQMAQAYANEELQGGQTAGPNTGYGQPSVGGPFGAPPAGFAPPMARPQAPGAPMAPPMAAPPTQAPHPMSPPNGMVPVAPGGVIPAPAQAPAMPPPNVPAGTIPGAPQAPAFQIPGATGTPAAATAPAAPGMPTMPPPNAPGAMIPPPMAQAPTPGPTGQPVDLQAAVASMGQQLEDAYKGEAIPSPFGQPGQPG